MEKTVEDIITGLVEITLPQEDNFLKVKETLTRIGISNKTNDKLYQSCHILQKRGKYYIVHFKELFLLDGKNTTLDDEDIARRNTIANLLSEWKLINLVDSTKTASPVALLNKIKVIPFSDKEKWSLQAKYLIGKKKSIVKVEETA